MTIDESLIDGIQQFEASHQDYLSNDGTINKLGLSLLRRLRVKSFNWNDRKMDDFEYFHLSQRTKKSWGSGEYYEVFKMIKELKELGVHEFFYKKCPMCDGMGVSFNEPPPRGDCKRCKRKEIVKKTHKEIMLQMKKITGEKK